MGRRIYGVVLDPRARWVFPEIVPVFPIDLRTYGAGAEATTAIRADVLYDLIYASPTEGTFIGADERLERVGRQ